VETAADPSDGRRTRVRVADGALHAISRRKARSIDERIAQPIADPDKERRATDLLESWPDSCCDRRHRGRADRLGGAQ